MESTKYPGGLLFKTKVAASSASNVRTSLRESIVTAKKRNQDNEIGLGGEVGYARHDVYCWYQMMQERQSPCGYESKRYKQKAGKKKKEKKNTKSIKRQVSIQERDQIISLR